MVSTPIQIFMYREKTKKLIRDLEAALESLETTTIPISLDPDPENAIDLVIKR